MTARILPLTPAVADADLPAAKDRAEQAVGFLLDFTRGEPALLTFINPTPEPGRSPMQPPLWLDNTPKSRAAAIQRLVSAEGRGHNCYWTPNAVRRDFKAPKPKEADVTHIRACYADLDPDDRQPREQARKALADRVAGLPPELTPYAVVDSGNGLQVLWRLPEPMPVDDHTRDTVKAIGKRAAERLKGDSVQNLDRLLRVPYMANYPDKKKQDRGRVTQHAGVHTLAKQDTALGTLESALEVAPGRDSANAPARDTRPPSERVKDLPAQLHGDVLAAAAAWPTDPKLAALWGNNLDNLTDANGVPFDGDRSRAVMSLLVKLAKDLPGDVTVPRLRQLAEQSPLVEAYDSDGKWTRLADSECGKAIKQANAYREADLERAREQFDAQGDDPDPCTDLANARRLKDAFGGSLRASALGKLVWDGRRWELNPQAFDVKAHNLGALIRQEAAGLLTELEQAPSKARRDALQKKAEHLRRWATTSENAARIAAAQTLVATEVHRPAGEFDRHPMLLTVENGTLDLSNGELKEHDPEDFITQLAPVAYDPQAKAPRFEQFLWEVFDRDKDLIDYIQRLFGYCLTGKTTDHVMPIFWGTGRNGKSTLIEIFKALLGDYARTAPGDLVAGKANRDPERDSVVLYGARLVSASESESGAALREAFIKTVTGGDRLRGRHLYREGFDFEPSHKLILLTNHKPEIKGTDPALWRRIHLVPFTQAFTGRRCDPNLRGKLLAELPGILAWAAWGCLAWQQFGLKPPRAVLAATDGYRSSQDRVKQFADERLDTTHPEARARGQDVFEDYQRWARANGWTPLGRNRFHDELERALGRECTTVRAGKAYPGVRLREPRAGGDFSPAAHAA